MKLPVSWREVRLADVCELGSGDGAPQEEQWFVSDGNLFVRTSDVSTPRDGAYITNTRDKLSDAAVDQLRLRTWKRNSLLLPKSGASALLNQRALLGVDACVVAHLAVLSPSEQLHHEYLYWWSIAFDAARVVPDLSYPSIRLQDLGRVKLPLPTLPEQQRIVDVLRQAGEIANQQQPRNQQLDLMIKAYLDRLVLAIDESEWVQLNDLVETRYGTSVSADAVADSGTPVLRIPNVMGGEVDTTDIKYVELSSAEESRLRLTRADVLIVRSNGNPDYVGRSAPITEDVEKNEMVYASYLIRLRANMDRLLPEYLSAFLNSAFGRAAMRNAIRTTAGQSNLSGENLTKIRIPLPTIREQKKFAAFWHEVRLLRQLISQSEQLTKQVRSELTVFALSGELTEEWREVHQQEIAAATAERDEALRERGTKVSVRFTEMAPPERPADFSRPARRWLVDELSEFQFEVWSMLRHEWRGSVIVDDPEVFGDFCTNPQTSWRIEHFKASPSRIRRALEQLAVLGLIAKVSLPKVNALTQQTEYMTAFRPLREDENTRMSDVDSLRRALRPDKPEGAS